MKRIRVAQFGTWRYTHAEHHICCLRTLPQYYEIVGICEPNEERWQEAIRHPAYMGLKRLTVEDILNDKTIDAVLVETSELEQDSAALIFAEAGFHIHVDKPCGVNHEVFEKLAAAMQKTGKVFQVGYMYRYNPAVRQALKMRDSGKLGEIICTEAHMSQCYHGTMREWLGTLPGGMMCYLGCHLVDLIYLIQGEPEEVIPYNTATNLEYPGIEDYGLVLFKYKHGISFIKTAACEVSGDARRQLVISGTNATFEVKPIEAPVPSQETDRFCANKISSAVTYTNHKFLFQDRPEVTDFDIFGRYDEMMIDFARMVAGEKPNDYGIDYELAVHRLFMKAIGV